LNVDADHIASDYHYLPNDDPEKVPLIAGCGAQLHINNKTITSNYSQIIRRAISFPALQSKIISKEKWTMSEFNFIDWTIHGIALRKTYQRKQFLTKLIHDCLPVGARIIKYRPTFDHHCPSCNIPMETRLHFLRCTITAQWKSDLFYKIDEFTVKTSPPVQTASLLIDALNSWFLDTPMENDYPDKNLDNHFPYTTLIIKQQQTGWH
jgi:hypothetical protein